MTDQAALYRRLNPTVWVCLHGDPPCKPGGRCTDGCRWVPTDQLPPAPPERKET